MNLVFLKFPFLEEFKVQQNQNCEYVMFLDSGLYKTVYLFPDSNAFLKVSMYLYLCYFTLTKFKIPTIHLIDPAYGHNGRLDGNLAARADQNGRRGKRPGSIQVAVYYSTAQTVQHY